MAFSKFYDINNSITADPVDLNFNFYFIAQGDRSPCTQSSKNVLIKADKAGSLGNSTSTWKALHAQSIYCNSITTAGKIFEQVIYEDVLTDTATTITISNLNGDEGEHYYLFFKYVGDSSANIIVEARFNSLDSQIYNNQNVYTSLPSAELLNGRRDAWIVCKATSDSSGRAASFGKNLLFTRTGMDRHVFSQSLDTSHSSSAKDIEGLDFYSFFMSNSSETITSITFFVDSEKFYTGTHITLIGRK